MEYYFGLQYQNLIGEIEETYWTSLVLRYEEVNNYAHSCVAKHQRNYHINMTNLELRTHFRAIAFDDEMVDWFGSGYAGDYKFDNLLRSRDVPDMGTYFPQVLKKQVVNFVDKYGQYLGIDNQTHGEEVKQWLHSLLMVVPQAQDNTLFYCLHCQNQVDIMIIDQQQQQHVCPRCGGWYLFEWDPVYTPMVPTNWDRVSYRLRHLGEQQPPLRDDAITEVDIGDLEAEDDSSCDICQDDYNLVEKVMGKLPCGHIFHSECVSNWFQGKPDRRHCPKCRRLVPTVDPLFNIQLRLIGMQENYPPPFP